MATFDVLVPAGGTANVKDLLVDLDQSPLSEPFSEERIEFVSDLSRVLSRAARGVPEIQALAYWMRKSEVHRLAANFRELESNHLMLMPRGTVFHVPPANVDTLFVYSFVLALLSGNRNIVRLSSRASDQATLILKSLNEVLLQYPDIARATSMVTYGHDQEITQEISTRCDVRVIWGGDQTVAMIRQIPLPPHAKELTFPDRFSMAALSTAAYSQLDDLARDALAEDFFNDSYWFDQLGCSSARLLIWVGDAANSVLSKDFHQRILRAIERKNYDSTTSTAIAKMGQALGSVMEEEISSYTQYSNGLTVLDSENFPNVRGEFCGGGLFYQMHVDTLMDLVPHIQRADQTLAAFGFNQTELRGFVGALQGRGIDRIVPFGQALQFSRIWDGYDLLQEFTRRVSVQANNP